MSKSESSSRNDRVLAAIADYLLAEERGEMPDRKTFLEQHSDIAAELESFIDNQAHFQKLAAEAGPGSPGDSDPDIDPNRPTVKCQDRVVSAEHDTGDVNVDEKDEKDADAIPAQIGRYLIESVLGKGGFGIVYLGHDMDLKRRVAIKVPRATAIQAYGGVEAFVKEAQSLAQLKHDGIVKIYDIQKTDDGRYFLVSEFFDGHTLFETLKNHRRLPPDVAVPIAIQIAEALQHAHKEGFVHRDLKPLNILMDQEGKPHILDFGLALHETEQADREGEFAGTLPYMSPQQLSGEAHNLDGRSDLWALGIILYEMLTGRLPFTGGTKSSLVQQIRERPLRPLRMIDETLPAELERIVGKCLEKSVTARYSSAQELLDDLRAWQQPLTNPVAEPRHKSSRAQWLRGLMAAGVAALAISFAFAFRPTSDGKTSGDLSQPSIPPEATPLRVMGIDVQHFAHTPKGDEPRGLLGQQTFTPSLGDRVQVKARLSKSAYAYLIAFRPDGEAELCFPDSEDVPPSLTDSPQHPTADGAKAYGLREGAGLWVFAVVASEEPLPAYRDWLKGRLPNEPSWSPVVDVPSRIVWWDDGQGKVSILTAADPGHPVRSNERGKDETLEGPAKIIADLTTSLRTTGDSNTASSIGFCVVP